MVAERHEGVTVEDQLDGLARRVAQLARRRVHVERSEFVQRHDLGAHPSCPSEPQGVPARGQSQLAVLDDEPDTLPVA